MTTLVTDLDSKARDLAAPKPQVLMNMQVQASLDILRGELERLFTLEEMTSLSERLLGLDPSEIGGAGAKGSFARALAERCFDGDRVDALVDVILHERREVDPRLHDVAALFGKEELAPGKVVGPFTIEKKVGESAHAIVYLARRDDGLCALKVLRREASRDKRAVQRFLTANRIVATVRHEGLPRKIEAGELPDGTAWVAYDWVEGQTLAQRLAKMGPSHVNELKAVLRGILEPLAALHEEGIAHGDLKLDNVIVGRDEHGNAHVTLIDFATDRLYPRPLGSNGHAGLVAVFGSPATIAPEIARGKQADARSDVYAFGAMTFALLTGRAPFVGDDATDTVVQHLTHEPQKPSAVAPRGSVTEETDAFVLSLLAKDPADRPRDAGALFDVLEGLGHASTALRAAAAISDEKVDELVEALIAAPDDDEAQLALDHSIEEGADANKVGEAFEMAAEQVDTREGGADGESAEGAVRSRQQAVETATALLYRAARIFEHQVKDKARAERVYEKILTLDANDEIALSALEDVRRAQGKFEAIVEMLLARSEAAGAPEDRARALAEIGRICENELDDVDQAVIAFGRALCEVPLEEQYARDIERIAGGSHERWKEALDAIAEGSKSESLSTTEKNALLAWAGRWYDQKLGRADTALQAYQAILATDPANDAASEGLSSIYRRAQQWPELATLLVARSESAVSAPKGRDLKTEAAELFETKLGDVTRARDLYAAVVEADPGHAKASDALARIAERSGDFDTLVKLLEQRAETRHGAERAEILARVAEVYEDHLNDLGEATKRYEAVLAIEPSNLDGAEGPRPHLQPQREVQGAAREPRAAGRGRRHAAPEGEPLGAHRGPPRRGVPRSRERRVRRSRACSRSTRTTTPRSPRCRVTTARSIAGTTS